MVRRHYSFVGNPCSGLKTKEKKSASESYFEAVKFLDGLTGVKKIVERKSILYSTAKPEPQDDPIKVYSIERGSIRANCENRTITRSSDLKLAEGLEEKLSSIIGGD